MKKILLTLGILISLGLSAQNESYYFTDNAIQISDQILLNDGSQIYVASNTSEGVFRLIKIGSNKQIIWCKKMPMVSYYSYPIITPSANGFFFSTYLLNGIGMDRLIIKMDLDGNTIWSKKWEMLEYDSAYDLDKDLIEDENGNIYSFAGTSMATKVLKMDSQGNKIFAKKIVNDTTSTKNPGFDFVRCPNGDFILTAKEGNTCIITRFNSDMIKVWSKKYPLDSYNHPKTIIPLPNNTYFVGGYALDIQGMNCFYSMILDPNGSIVSKNYYLEGLPFVYPRKFILEGNEILFWNEYGYYGSFNLSGELQELKQLDDNIGNTASLDKKDNSYVMSKSGSIYYFHDLDNLGCIPVYSLAIPERSSNINNNNCVSDAQLFVKPLFDTVVDAPFSFYSVTQPAFVKMCETLEMESPDKTELRVYPNPATNQLRISAIEGLETYSITDLQGKLVSAGPVSGTIDVSALNPGMYLLHLNQNNQAVFQDKILIER